MPVDDPAWISISDLTISGKYQMRVKLDKELVQSYCQLIQDDKESWPFDDPCTVYRVGERLILVDGFHRVKALRLCNETYVGANVIDGTDDDAVDAALLANERRGKATSNADKRHKVRSALTYARLRKLSNRILAERCGVHHQLVASVRAELDDSSSSAVKTRVASVRVQLDESSSCTVKTRNGKDNRNRPATKESAEAQREAIASAIEENTELSDRKIAEVIGCSNRTVGNVRRGMKEETTDEPQAAWKVSSIVQPYASPREASPQSLIEILQTVLAMIRETDRTSDQAVAVMDLVNEIHAAACSKLCDMEPIDATEQMQSSGGHLFPEAAREKKIAGRMKITEAEFEAFYAAFPRRVNKAKSKIAFQKAFEVLRKTQSPDESIATIMQGARVYSANVNPDAVCHPTTWLNGCRWEDDPDGIGSKAGRRNGIAYVDRSRLGKFTDKDMNMTDDEYEALAFAR